MIYEDFFPTVEDVLAEESVHCEICNRSFSNSSAVRLHRVKVHRAINSEQDRKIYGRGTNLPLRRQFFHCPLKDCFKKELKFDGMRNLRQHYFRVHSEKTLSCDCGTLFALNKDLLYHKKRRCPLRPDKDDPPPAPAPKKVPKRKRPVPLDPEEQIEIVPELPEKVIVQPVVLVVPSTNVDETFKHLSQILKTTATVGVQAEVGGGGGAGVGHAETNTIAVGGETAPQTEFCDFSGQYNAPCSSNNLYYYTPDVRDTSTGTDFTMSGAADQLFYAPNEFASYEYAGSQGNGYSNEPQPLTRSFGTTMDDFKNDFYAQRDIETQTMGEMTNFWMPNGE